MLARAEFKDVNFPYLAKYGIAKSIWLVMENRSFDKRARSPAEIDDYRRTIWPASRSLIDARALLLLLFTN